MLPSLKGGVIVGSDFAAIRLHRAQNSKLLHRAVSAQNAGAIERAPTVRKEVRGGVSLAPAVLPSLSSHSKSGLLSRGWRRVIWRDKTP